MVLKTKKDTEIWKAHCNPKLVEKYEISNFGNIRNALTGKALKQNIRSGYYSFCYSFGEHKKQSIKTHRLVAILFVNNPMPVDYTIVNHLDGNKLNNKADNLEWCSSAMNNAHAQNNGLSILNKRNVVVLDLENEQPFGCYSTLSEALKVTGVSPGAACAMLNGTKNPSGKYSFIYNDNKDDTNMKNKEIDLSEYKQMVGMPGYLINKKGNIYGLRFKKFMKYGKHKEGSMQTTLNKDGKSCTVLAHRMVASYFLKRTDPKHNSIKFKDGNKSNFHVDNLEWCYVPGVQSPESYVDQSYYNPKTAISLPKVKRNSAKP